MSAHTACHLPQQVIESLERVIDYLFEDERRHYETTSRDDKNQHIYRDLRRVRKFLNERASKDKEIY